ncbi:hypothetical protein HK100_006060, partial [Physocladia obscura]
MPLQQLLLVTACSEITGETAPDYAICAKNPRVQQRAAQWSLRLQMAEQIPALFILLGAGYFVDALGRRWALRVAGVSAVAVAFASLFVSLFDNASLWFLVAAFVLSGFCGGILLFRLAASAYISDSSSIAHRTKYFLFLDAAFNCAITVGPLIGAILTVIGFLLAGAQVFFLFYPSKMFGWDSLDFGQFALIAASQK